MKHRSWLAVSLIAATLALSPCALAERGAPPDPLQDKAMLTAGFLNGHPDLRFRMVGLERRDAGKQSEAFRFFQRAAYYSDKPSQAMVAEMLWNGTGIEQDRALAYAWMDLAAERGYEGFLELRERYWLQLDEAQRERAIAEGQAIYATYGDAAAQPRLATALRREVRKTTGSRTGFTGFLRIIVPGPAGPEEIDASKFYDDRFWDPVKYQAWQDSIWMKPRVASVEIGDIGQIPPAGKDSRIPTTAPLPDAVEPVTEDVMPKVDDGSHKP